ncbi:TPA: hypothetical protein N0F65_011109 [Lagenidium giganteum]|uniref:Uncharacterized protein n=1 Tax=Lagenidium giganteum TaxID=4803 RepID=A0AAV2ZEB4_9STRA|nr:TPA: hypothetical protein N0F65_011109 [Lagenidium giganteum]
MAARVAATDAAVATPQHDIDAHVPWSWGRCLSSLFALVLLATDIPRTGFGTIKYTNLYPSVAPDTVINYGPYEHSVVRLARNSSHDGAEVVTASCDGVSLDAAPLWSYKFDTLSIPSRAMAAHLNVSSYPRCVFYDGECDGDLDPSLVLTMLDSLISSLQCRYFAGPGPHAPFEFITKSNWIDRLHHYVEKRFGLVNQEVHMHHVHYFGVNETQRLDICYRDAITRRASASVPMIPRFCALGAPWIMAHPLDLNAVDRRYQLWEHVAIRMALLREAYPGLEFDITVIMTHYTYTNKQAIATSSLLAEAFLRAEDQEITTWIRGRHCDSGECTTVVFDDYRYERIYSEQNPNEILLLTAVLRGGSQLYMWIRLVLLWCACYKARAVERRLRSLRARVVAAWKTFFRIPSHVIVYGSWVPVLGYAVAHYVDCGQFHLLFYCLWSTSNGVDNFDFFPYLKVASIQMRNAWMFSLFIKLMVLVQTTLFQPRHGQTLQHAGLVSIRRFVIGLTSAISVFAQWRRLEFRDTNIVYFQVLPATSVGREARIQRKCDTYTEFGFHYEILVLSVSFGVVVICASIWRILLQLEPIVTCRPFAPRGIIFARSFYVPFSTGVLFPVTMLDVFWKFRTKGGVMQGQANAEFVRAEAADCRFNAECEFDVRFAVI